jgi:proton-coupled amino acid transporter
MWDMIGFSFYSFEGIGCILPVMRESKNPDKFPKLLKIGLISLTIFFTVFALVTYAWFGYMAEPIVINNMDSTNWFIKTTKLLYCINLVFSYPLAIYPTNRTLERLLFSRLEEGLLKYWLSNVTRFGFVFLGCFSAIVF